MTSKIVSDKQKGASSIDALIDTNLETISVAAEQLLAPHLSEKVDLRPLMRGLRAFLSSHTRQLAEASQAHEKELSDDPEALKNRDDASEALYSLLTRTREILVGVYGVGALSSLGFSGSTPQDPSLLSAYAKAIVATTKESVSKLSPIDEGLSYDPTKKLVTLEAAIERVDSTLSNVAKEKREADQTLAAKNLAIDGYDKAFSRVANALVGLFALVGQEDLARKARPSTRRPGQTEEDET